MALMAATPVLTRVTSLGTLDLPPVFLSTIGVAAGFGIDVVAAIMVVGSASGAGQAAPGRFPGLVPIPAHDVTLLISAPNPRRHH